MSTTRCALALLLLAAVGLHGQSRSTILGTVTDESGAPIPGAEVKILNTGKPQQRAATTSERGDYEVTSLDIGLYEVSAQAPGFSVSVVRGVLILAF